MPTKIYLPRDTQHLAVIGRNGTGKTQAAAWQLSKSNFQILPRVIMDFKGEELINAIERARHIDYSEVPKYPGLYILHPTPGDIEDGIVDNYLIKMYERENIGGWIDEGYMLGNSRAFRTVLTQGRSKHIPLIVLSQRPSWISRFVFSESSFFQVFHLNDRRDKQIVEGFVPVNMEARLPEYHSYYYDVTRDTLVKLKPVPSSDEILEVLDTRLAEIQRKVKRAI